MTRFALVLGMVSLLAEPCIADEFGTVSGTLGGEPRNWYTVTAENGERIVATATLKFDSRFTDLHIQAGPTERFTTRDVISIDLTYFGDIGDGSAPASVEIIYLPEGMSAPFWTTAEGVEGSPSVSFDLLETTGETGRTVGRFSGRLCYKAGLVAPVDPGNCMDVEGVFDTALQIERTP